MTIHIKLATNKVKYHLKELDLYCKTRDVILVSLKDPLVVGDKNKSNLPVLPNLNLTPIDCLSNENFEFLDKALAKKYNIDMKLTYELLKSVDECINKQYYQSILESAKYILSNPIEAFNKGFAEVLQSTYKELTYKECHTEIILEYGIIDQDII